MSKAQLAITSVVLEGRSKSEVARAGAGQLSARRHHQATLLTMIEVDGDDPAFGDPTKPIGPVCAHSLAVHDPAKGDPAGVNR